MLNQFSNSYFALRHAKSLANEKGIIVSYPENGISAYGLSETGRKQCETAFRIDVIQSKYPEITFSRDNCIIQSSDFLRAKETAEYFSRNLKLNNVQIDSRLRERNFGELEFKQGDLYYEKIWQKDKKNPENSIYGVESTLSVSKRLEDFIKDMEKRYRNKNIIAVSHGDTLQIFQTIFKGILPNEHRSLKHLENAELRLLYKHKKESAKL